FSVQSVELVATTDMRLANPNLWKGRAGAYAVVHLLAHRRILARVIFGERGFLAVQKRFGRTAIAAARPCIDFNGSHLALALTNKGGLYGSSGAIDNPGKDQHIHLRRLGAQQGAGAGVGGGARCQDVVDQDDPPSGDLRLPVRGYLEGALHIAGPLGTRQPDL